MKAWMVGGCVLVLVLLAFSLTPPKNTIVLTEDGFHPRVLTVNENDTVTFVNGRDKYFWPATDFHPTHTLFPAFDAGEPLAPGASYTFTFKKSGVYPFHDHLSAFYFGIIRVKDAQGVVADNCHEQGGDFQCWQNEVFFALAEHGVDAAYDEVTRLYEAEPTFTTSCHSIAHNIGLASYQFYTKNPDFILSPQATACGAGFYHGFMEGYIGATGDILGAQKVCDDIGERLSEEAPDARLQCYHGIGHGAVETSVASSGSFGSRDAFITEALKSCASVSEGQERYRCASGVFNGIANFYITGAYGLSATKESPYLLCARQAEEYKESCYGNMNSVVYHTAQGSFVSAVTEVLSIPEVDERPKALEYLMKLFALNHLQDESLAPRIQECKTLPDTYVATCIDGFTRGLLEHGVPGREYERALSVCRAEELSPSERDTCYHTVLTEASGWYGKEKVEEICASVSYEERAYCAS